MVTRKYYYWLKVIEPETGKHHLVYGGETEQEARDNGLEMLSGIDFEIKRLPTRNLAMASSMVRGKRLEDTHSLKRASEKIGHQKSIKRLLRRRGGIYANRY